MSLRKDLGEANWERREGTIHGREEGKGWEKSRGGREIRGREEG